MKFGLFSLMTQRDPGISLRDILRDTVEMVRLADEIGFDIAWFAEHHFSNYSICPSPMMMASYFAPLTKRIRLGAAVLVLPLYHPMRMVQEIGLLDLQSEGRAVIGIGSGYQKFEFDRFDRGLDDKINVLNEVWDIMEMALTTGAVAYEGRYFTFPYTPLTIRPLQRPMPELFVTGIQPEVLRRCAVSGGTPFLTAGWQGLPVLAKMREAVVQSYESAAADTAALPLAVQQYIHVTDSKKDALDFGERARYMGRVVACMRAGDPELDGIFIQAPPLPDEPALETFRDRVITGSPEYCAERIAEDIRVLRPTHYSCFMHVGSLDGKKALRSLERFGAEVIPLLEKEFGALDRLNLPATPMAAVAQAGE